MFGTWYRKWIGRFIFRKLNIGIGAALLLVFLLLGLVIYNNVYTLLEQKERELLEFRTEKLKLQLTDILERFKYDTGTVYQNMGGGDERSMYELFLPDNVAEGRDGKQAVFEQNYMKNVLTNMLTRNPFASAVIMYRIEDGRLFAEFQRQEHRLNESYPFDRFFDSFPKGYRHPYLGSSDELLTPADRQIYIVNPIYNPLTIHPDQVYGYHLTALNAKAIANEFDSRSSAYRLIIKQDDAVLLDSRPDETSDWQASDDLVARASMDRYRIEIVGISYKSNLQSKLADITLRISLILGACWIICVAVVHLIQRFVVGRFNQMSAHFKKVQRNPFTPLMPVRGEDEIGDLMARFNRMAQELQNHINQVYVSEIRKRNAEFIALKTQIHPHFLYNTLESLRMQAVISEQPYIAEKLHLLGRLYRWMLQPTDELISVQEELANTRDYLELLMLGKSNRIELRVDAEVNLENCFMLKFTLQPIVENAIQHGRLEEYEDPVIRVDIRKEDGLLLIQIQNNGRTMTEDERERLLSQLQDSNAFPGQHLGLKNIHERIKHFYGVQYGLSLPASPSDSEPFRLFMTFPYKR
ncbi:sensor histidine kinase [Cohnella cellulosilytica]|uniref:Sensor histidine kinase n=1 Tax=Cohnella cellulosilytica TaxID=986710 RepID=A0ABW2FKR9_9BACL